MSVKECPHYTVPASMLAEWLDRRPDTWWMVDGDPDLTSSVDFPCPGDELAAAIRNYDRNLVLRDRNPHSTAHGDRITIDQLESLGLNDRHGQRSFVLSWADSNVDWLLSEDRLAAK
jgi:hypothetical protein